MMYEPWGIFLAFVLVVTGCLVLTVVTWWFEQWLRRVTGVAKANRAKRLARAELALTLPFDQTGLTPDPRTPIHDSIGGRSA